MLDRGSHEEGSRVVDVKDFFLNCTKIAFLEGQIISLNRPVTSCAPTELFIQLLLDYSLVLWVNRKKHKDETHGTTRSLVPGKQSEEDIAQDALLWKRFLAGYFGVSCGYYDRL